VDQQTLNQTVKFEGAYGVQCAERQNYQVHHEKEADSVKDSADDEVVFEDREPAAGDAIDGCGRECDEVVEKDAEDPDRDAAALDDLSAQQSGSNGAGNIGAIGNECSDQIERAGDGAAHKNGKSKASRLAFYGIRCGRHCDLVSSENWPEGFVERWS